jgi:uncharacterized protein (DUF433 family)
MKWMHLERKPNSANRQLFVAGTRIMASHIAETITAEEISISEASEIFGVSVDAVKEALKYSTANKLLIDSEARKTEAELKTLSLELTHAALAR